jgi:hypothetical protein
LFIQEILPFLLDVDISRSSEILSKTLGYSIQSDLVCFNNLVYVSDSAELCLSILKSVYDSSSSGHFDQPGLFDMLTRHYWWPDCRKFVKNYVSSCHVCARGNDSHQKSSGLLQPLSVPSRPWNSISWDFITNLPSISNDNNIILTIVEILQRSPFYSLQLFNHFRTPGSDLLG